ncbi:MAG: TatD family hydrolase [Gemmatimonadaceae bacterium]|nr:TatD family hydrolase [Gemmatimonadaceae bacterium]
MLIDSHAHLAGEKFDADRGPMLQRAWAAGVTHVVVIGDLTNAARDMARTDPLRLSFTAGVHPHEAHLFQQERDMPVLRRLVSEGAVAVGECGLDYYYDHSPRALQVEAFQRQLDLAVETALPVVVHTRQAEDDTARMLDAAAARGVRGVLHCFTGSPELARRAIDAGWCLSISGIATFRTWDRDDVVAMIPDAQLLVETDAPYLAPVPNRGKRNESSFLPATVERLAVVRGTTADALATLTATNAIRFFRLPIPSPLP